MLKSWWSAGVEAEGDKECNESASSVDGGAGSGNSWVKGFGGKLVARYSHYCVLCYLHL